MIRIWVIGTLFWAGWIFWAGWAAWPSKERWHGWQHVGTGVYAPMLAKDQSGQWHLVDARTSEWRSKATWETPKGRRVPLEYIGTLDRPRLAEIDAQLDPVMAEHEEALATINRDNFAAWKRDSLYELATAVLLFLFGGPLIALAIGSLLLGLAPRLVDIVFATTSVVKKILWQPVVWVVNGFRDEPHSHQSSRSVKGKL